jgi:hypothetical protein
VRLGFDRPGPMLQTLGLLLASVSVGSAQDTLTPSEREEARAVADSALVRRGGPLAQRRVFTVDVELFRDKEREEAGQVTRQAVVTHYQYDGDRAILTYVDLRARQIFLQETIPHLPVPLAPEELAEAKQLALADSGVARALAPYRQRLVVEPLVVRTTDPADPLSGQRVVRLLFRVGADYLRRPIVTVNLSTRSVAVDEEVQ